MSRCATRDKPFPLPPSLPIELARSHPRFKHWLEPGAQCELESGHIGPHRAGLLVWHRPADRRPRERVVVNRVPGTVGPLRTCPFGTPQRSSCKRRSCPVCGPRWARDWKTVMLVNLEAYDGPVVMVSVTPPGVDRLPWDEEHCRHPHGGRHDGKRGCRVQQRAAREWNETAVHRLSMLRRAASQHVRRHVRDADGEPVPVNLLERVWEPQKRGVAHVHLVFGGRTTEELEAVAEFVTKTKALARDYDFGFVDAKGTKRRDDPRSRGRRLTVRGVELKLIPAGEAARYLSSYLCGRSKYKPSIRENAIAPAMVALSGDRLRAHRLPLVWLTPKLTKATLVTMRTLRRARQLYAVFAGRYYDDRGNTAPAWFYELRDVLEAALIFRRTRRRDGKRGDDDAAVAAFVQDTIERVEAMESGWPRLVQYREAMRYVRLIADPPARIVQPRERLLAAAA